MGERVDEVALPAEQRARLIIDRQLSDAGWIVQGRGDLARGLPARPPVPVLALRLGRGVARREVMMKSGHGRADYLLLH